MRISKKHYIITEYDHFTRGKEDGVSDDNARNALPTAVFDALESFILANNSSANTKAVDLLSLSARRGAGKLIAAKNHVGLITTNDGTVIEILPKIHGVEKDIDGTKRIFLDMLRTLREIPSKDFNVSNLKTDRLSLFEIFIKMFVSEVISLTKQGLKSAYISIEENVRFCKGKLLVAQNIKHNLISKERFFVRYDEFSLNRPENRLIKSALRYLYGYTQDHDNKRNINRLLSMFEAIDFSANYDSDFSKCADDRSVTHYQNALGWAKVFLRKKSFTAFAGSGVAIALLFPMEKVFESYIAEKIRKHGGLSRAKVRTQDSGKYLFIEPKNEFALRPDIVIEKREEDPGQVFVMDTKWKILDSNLPHYGIAQSDMYQMYAYGKKYGTKSVKLIYPKTDAVSVVPQPFISGDGVTVRIAFVDLRKEFIDNDIDGIIKALA